MMADIEPVRVGRVANRAKALDKDGNIDFTLIKHPANMIGTIIRHDEYHVGFVHSVRMKIAKKGSKKAGPVVYQVSFGDAPGGPQKFEMEEVELIAAVKNFKDWGKKERKTPDEEWD